MTTLNTKATNEGTYIITCSFTDADETAVTPNALTWTLTDYSGNVINNRDEVTVATGTSVTVVLTDADIDIDDGVGRIFTIEGTYNSSTYGNNLPIREQARFNIESWYDKV